MKYCTNCGKSLEENAKFCDGCGTEVVTETTKEETLDEAAAPVESLEANSAEITPVESVEANSVEVTPVESVEVNSSETETLEQVEEIKTEVAEPTTTETPVEQSTTETPVQSQEPKIEPLVSEPVVVTEPIPVINSQTNAPVQTEFPAPKKNTGLIVVIVILGIIILGLVGVIGYKMISNEKNESPQASNNNNNNTPSTTTPENTTTTTETTITYNNYIFTIPEGYEAKVDGEYLNIINRTDKIQMIGYLYDFSYQIAKADQASFKNSYTSLGYQVVQDIKEETYGGKKMFSMDLLTNNTPCTAAVVEVNDYACLEVAYVNYGTKTSTEIKTTIANISSSAKSKSSSLANNEDKKYEGSKIKDPKFTIEK